MMAMGVYFGGWAILMLIDQFRIFSPVMMFRIISLTPVGILALTDFKQLTLKDQNWLILSLVINTIVLIAMYCWALSRLEKPVKTRG
jgi:fumarate reductase subunit D